MATLYTTQPFFRKTLGKDQCSFQIRGASIAKACAMLSCRLIYILFVLRSRTSNAGETNLDPTIIRSDDKQHCQNLKASVEGFLLPLEITLLSAVHTGVLVIVT
jgi:hypothetical protein